MPLPEPAGLIFTSMFPGWNRLEARSRKDDFAFALAARTADPLWALGRQWQFLELKGEDAATPIRAILKSEAAVPNELQLGSNQYAALDGIPLEVLVEQEEITWDWRLRVRAGQQYERLARLHDPTHASALINQAHTLFPISVPTDGEWIQLDLASRRFVSLMEGRAIDGKTLHKEIYNGGLTTSISALWKTWFEDLYAQPLSGPSPAWQSARLDYEFGLRQGTPTPSGSLRAASYRNGTVDWDTFVIDQSPATTFAMTNSLPLTPTHAIFAGQPMRRFWAFEDAVVDFGALDVAKTDLGKLLFMEFALIFGDDWFVLPLTADPNSLVRITGLEVQDCFGIRTAIDPARVLSSNPLKSWQVFELASKQRNGASGDFLYVPPPAGGREESPILEEVRFARDEGANLVFAIEHTVPNQLGEPASGFTLHLELLRRLREASGHTSEAAATESPDIEVLEGAEPAFPPSDLKYVLATKVPANWIPYLATDEQNVTAGLPNRSVKLRQGVMASAEDSNGLSIAPLSRLLDNANWIHEEAVGRAGVRVELRRHRMRSAKGKTFVWLGRKVGVGKGEARSGLRFDGVMQLESTAT